MARRVQHDVRPFARSAAGSRPDPGPAPGQAAARLAGPLERLLVPDLLRPDGQVDQRVALRYYRRFVLAFAIPSNALFVLSLGPVGVPAALWPSYITAAILSSIVITTSVLLPRPGSVTSLITACCAALAILALNGITSPYFHHAVALFCLVMVAQALIQGVRSALIMVASGAMLMPVSVAAPGITTPLDLLFSAGYLAGTVILVWTNKRIRDRAAAALGTSETRYRELLERIPAVVYACGAGPDGRWTYVSPRVDELLGFEPSAWTEDPGFWWSRIVPEDHERVLAEERESWAHPTDGRSIVEYRMIHRDGSVRWISDEATAVPGSDGAPSHWSGFLIDITEKRQLGVQLRQAQRLETVGQLAGGIAHDFNNLLTAMRGYGELIRADVEDHGGSTEDADELIRAAERATLLTRQLLTFSRRQGPTTGATDASAVVAALEPMLRRLLGEHIDLLVVLPPAPAVTSVDATQLEQVVMNLAVNARDAMPAGGRLLIRVASVADDPSSGRAYLRLTVADNGSGMDETTRARMFEPFFTTKAPGRGTGLGLATVCGIVREAGGRIDCESAPGVGTSFEVDLPLQDAPASDIGTAPGTLPTGSELVLVVEDDATVREVARRRLAALGYRVIEAGGPAEAIDLLDAAGDSIDLLLTDIIMPGMLGTELARRARATRPQLAVLFMSGYPGDQWSVETAAEVGPLLQKPFDAQAIALAVRAAIDERAVALRS